MTLNFSQRAWVEADEVDQTPDKNLGLEKEEVDCSRLPHEQYIEKTFESHACEMTQLADGRFQLTSDRCAGRLMLQSWPTSYGLKK